MPEQPSKQREAEDVLRVDHLLDLIRENSRREPSSEIRERLAALASQRLQGGSPSAEPIREGGRRRRLVWLKPAIAALVVAAAGISMVSVFRFRRHEVVESPPSAHLNQRVASPVKKVEVEPPARVQVSDQHTALSRGHQAPQSRIVRRMILRLPYSNNAIETGTGATIRVSMSQSELLSLGFPINATVQDRRIVAELTLGDDGLPRAISLPLPLEVMKEKE
jgi:hypothetical protein